MKQLISLSWFVSFARYDKFICLVDEIFCLILQ